MRRRAARMLAALEAGCSTREEIFAHQGRFSLLNNAAAELRAAGVGVRCELVGGEHQYSLVELSQGSSRALPSVPPAPLTELDSGQLTWEIAA